MTNETTASQPKSIGDDAQNEESGWAYGRAKAGTPVPGWGFVQDQAEKYGGRVVGNKVSFPTAEGKQQFDIWYAENAPSSLRLRSVFKPFRAPAPQASATIQAAPELLNTERLGLLISYVSVANRRDGWAAENSYFGSEDLARAAKAVENAERNLLEYVKSIAATIQEPVMVAEPVGAWTVTVHCDLGRVHDSAGNLIATTYGNDAKRFVDAHNATLAAPMVADPAGVVAKVAGRREDFANYSEFDEERIYVRGWNDCLAATVKAVPSEALDAARYRFLRKGFGDMGPDVDLHNAFVDGGEKMDAAIDAAIKSAVPLADKTGGGE